MSCTVRMPAGTRWTLRARERTLPVRGGLAVAPISCGSPLPSERVAGASPAAAACSKSWPPGCRAAFPSAVGALEFSRGEREDAEREGRGSKPSLASAPATTGPLPKCLPW
eukprot:1139402-Pelagomonas_calceolata.AAC.6